MKILLAHGSPAAAHAVQVQALAADVSALLGEQVGCAFLSDSTLPQGATLLPLFLGEGTHVRQDIPQLAAASGCSVLPPLAAHAETVASMAYDLVTQQSRRVNALFALYRFAGFEALTAALHAQNKRCSLVAMASMHSEPSVATLLQHWQREGVGPITLQAMLLFEGHTLDRLCRAGSGADVTMMPVLSRHEGFAALVAACLKESI